MIFTYLFAGALALVYVVLVFIALFGELAYVIHTPEYKRPRVFILISLWFLLSLVLTAAAFAVSVKVFPHLAWYLAGFKVLAIFFIAGYGLVNLYKSADFCVTGVDYDAIAGKRHHGA
ncbi:MAG TPA: hypothetical protein VFT82_00605 [Candidatus Paceibacterota bacterium]|nr:hypothetical protein [Candidatus Paceibacterota bacterium]